MTLAPEDSIHPKTLQEWHAWLAENHATSKGVWFIYWRKESGETRLSYEDSVCEALCWGWVDSTAKVLDEMRTMQRYTPRRKHSNWTPINKGRVERLIAEGRMMPAGLAQVEAAKTDGRWTMLDDAVANIAPDELLAALDALPPARANYDAFPPSVKRGILAWIASAKQAETRARRIAQTAEMAQSNLRAQFDKPTDPSRPVRS